MQRRSQCRRAGIIDSTKKFEAVQSSAGNQHQTNERKRGTRNSQRTTNTIYTRGGCHLQGNLVVNFSPGWSEGPGALRPLVGSKGAVGKGMLTIASFADMTIPTLTQRPATGTIIPRSTILNGVEGTLGWAFDEGEVWGRGVE